ncbi:thiamine phosphate synthase [Myxococcus fulvus]|uniref:thiamine phosphate synthase n=1 Tax=Myxococcus fulvus TaxID=33 RepID=UPI003B9C6BEA
MKADPTRSSPTLGEKLSVYVIVSGRTRESLLEAVLAAGVRAIQFREKDMPLARQLERARRFREQCREVGALFIVNDRLDLALAVEADGAHVGQEDLPADVARRLLGPDRILGVSCATEEEARIAIASGADYLGTGPLYSTSSKSDAGEPLGVGAVERICRGISVPVVGIGGIGPGRADPVIRAGARGVAVISAVEDAPDPEAAARALLREVQQAQAPR